MKKIFSYCLIKVLCLSLFFVSVTYADSGRLEGNIFSDSNSLNINNIEIIITNAITEEEVARTLSNNEGKFLLENLTEGTYKVSFNKAGVLIKDTLVTIKKGQTVSMMPIAESAEMAIETDTVKVTAFVNTGYRVQRKEEVTSAHTTISEEELNQGLNNDPLSTIKGKVSGLNISRPGSDPNAGVGVVRLRGISTLGQNAAPLIVIDGVIGASLDSVDPANIQSVDVIKDDASAAIYGTRGSSGVIIITTKKAKFGDATTFNYAFSTTMESIANTVPVASRSEYLSFEGATDLGGDTSWLDLVSQDSVTSVHNLALSGAGESSSYRATINYRNQEGILKKTGLKGLNATLNFSQAILEDRGKITLNLSNTTKERNLGFSEVFRYALLSNPTLPVYDPSDAGKKYGEYMERAIFDYYNPVSIMNQAVNDQEDTIFLGTLSAEYDFKDFVEGLKFRVNYSKQITDVHKARYHNNTANWLGVGRNGLAIVEDQKFTFELFETTATYDFEPLEDLKVSSLVGYSFQEYFNEGNSIEGGGFLTNAFSYNNLGAAQEFDQGLGTISSFSNSNKLIGVLSSVNLSYQDTYMLNLNLRREGSSRFGANNKWGDFFGIGSGVNLTNLMDIQYMDDLKVRLSFGRTGNEPVDSYISLQKYGPSGNYYNNGLYSPAYAPSSNPNPDLKWEISEQTNLGFDFVALEGTLYGSLDIYEKNTKDLILNVNVPVPPNLVGQTQKNVGQIKNTGFELDINQDIIDTGDFSWTTGLLYSRSKSKLVKLTVDGGVDTLYLSNLGAPGQNAYNAVRVKEGEPLGQLFGPVMTGVDAEGLPIFKDINGDGTYCDCPDDKVVIGNGIPDYTIGWKNVFKYKDFDISLLFQGEVGHDLVNIYRVFYENLEPTTVGNWNVVKTDNFDPKIKKAVFNNTHVEDASYFELSNLTIGYNVPKNDFLEGFKIKSLRFYLSFERPFVITNYEGIDPVARYFDVGDEPENANSLGIGMERRSTYFRSKSITFGLKAGF